MTGQPAPGPVTPRHTIEPNSTWNSVPVAQASFDISIAAQVQTPTEEDCTTLNKRLQWQKDHQQRGLTYIPIDLANAKLIVFTDGSFANNKDLSSQLGFVIALVNETETARTKDQFGIKGNVLHWSSTKCKRVTRSVLASEIYGMVNGFDIGISLATTIRKITDRLNLPPIP
ncbi:polyprotein [Hirsutella rhossiliensis]|uniref:Polyprotein n=1 Tax=Hirsutella rhossiliensis TaxID=111463 RepID=A0A9P8SHY2_9HYPO|nr:polyprotein [Hirsutella rhossiliensis]KAH0962045.1 polyprotein [Hirsutella rhossiliensis]